MPYREETAVPLKAVRTLMFAALAGLAVVGQAAAQSAWPQKPITFIVPFAAGGGTDAFARPLAQQLDAQLGKRVLIENRAGAGGTVGASLAARRRRTATPSSWARRTTRSRRRCIRTSITTSRRTLSRWR
jgi:tripartite-type tricarboxylate transporter receptor subunit TctC